MAGTRVRYLRAFTTALGLYGLVVHAGQLAPLELPDAYADAVGRWLTRRKGRAVRSAR